MSAYLLVLALACGGFGLAVAAMGIGAMFKRPCLRGSCGGAPVRAADGQPLSCADCPNRRAA